MRRLVVCLLFAAMVGCGDASGPDNGMAPAAQLLSNADMERRAADWWSGGNSPSDFVAGWSSSQSVSGAQSLSLSDATGSTDGFAFWAQTVVVVNPTRMLFELSVSVQVADLFGEGVALAIRADDSSLDNGDAEAFVSTRGTVLIEGTEDWATYSVQLGGLPAGIDQITVYLMYLPNSSGVAYFDDAVLSATRVD